MTVVLASSLVVALTLACLWPAMNRLGIVAPVLCAMSLRLFFGFSTHFGVLGSPTSDTRTYDRLALDVSTAWESDITPPGLIAGKEGWVIVLASIYRVIGHAPEVGIALNAGVGAATVLITAATSQTLGWGSSRRVAAWCMALWPVGVFWGPQLLREAIVTFLVALAVLGIALIGARRTLVGTLLLMLSGSAMIWMRGGLAYFILVVMPTTYAVARLLIRSGDRRRWQTVLPTMLLLTGVLTAGLELLSSGYTFSVDRIQAATSLANTGSTSFSAAGVPTENDALALVNVAVGPLPFSWRNFGLLIAGLDGVLWATLWIFAVWGYRASSVNRWAPVTFLSSLVALLAFLSLTTANFGTIMRYRSVGVPLLIPVAAVGLHWWLTRNKLPADPLPSRPATPHSIDPLSSKCCADDGPTQTQAIGASSRRPDTTDLSSGTDQDLSTRRVE